MATGNMRKWLRAEGIESLRGASGGGSKKDRATRMYPPPRVFCEKSSEVTDLMGVDFLESAKEFARV